jgi:hypothetical protein
VPAPRIGVCAPSRDHGHDDGHGVEYGHDACDLDIWRWHAGCFDHDRPMKPPDTTLGQEPAIRASSWRRGYDDTVVPWYETAGVASVIGLLLAAAVMVGW